MGATWAFAVCRSGTVGRARAAGTGRSPRVCTSWLEPLESALGSTVGTIVVVVVVVVRLVVCLPDGMGLGTCAEWLGLDWVVGAGR